MALPNWMIGVVLASLGSLISNLGLNLQKLNHINNNLINEQHDNIIHDEFVSLPATVSYQNGNSDTAIQSITVQPVMNHSSNVDTIQTDYTQQKLWQVGLMCVILGSIADFIALVYAAQSIVAPLGSLTLVSNTLLAPVILHESINWNDILSTMIIIIGSVLAVIFASHTDHILTIPQLLQLFTTNQFMIYCVCTSVVCIVLYQCNLQLVYYKQASPPLYVNYIKYHRFILASLSGIIGAQSVLLAKVTAQLIANTVSGNSILFIYWQSYVIMIGLFTAIVTQIRILNSALQQFDALYIVPVFQSFWILMSVLSGMILFNESHDVFQETGRGIGFIAGVLLTIFGVYYLSQRGTVNVSGDVELSQFNNTGTTQAYRQQSMDTMSQYSMKSISNDRAMSDIGNMQCDILLLPMLQKRHHRVFNSPSITMHHRITQPQPIDAAFMSTPEPFASPLMLPSKSVRHYTQDD